MDLIRFENYILTTHYRRGGQGNIFLGYQVSHGTEKKLRDVVVKIIRKEDSVESQLASLETHSNVITIFDSGTISASELRGDQRGLLCSNSQGEFKEHKVSNCSKEHEQEPITWISMEYSTQGSLQENANQRFARRDTYSEDETVLILNDILHGLDHAHKGNILHGDIKPGNILYFDQTDSWKISDFGIARKFSADTNHTMVLPAADGQGHPGTNLWMAPEQRAGLDIGPSTDIYAVGLIGYYLISGQNYGPDIAPLDIGTFGHVLQKCLEHDPKDRYQRAEDVLIELGYLHSPVSGNVPTGSQNGFPYNDYLKALEAHPGPLEKIQETIRFLCECNDLLIGGVDPESFYDLVFEYAVNSGARERGTERVRNRIMEDWQAGQEYRNVEDWQTESEEAEEARQYIKRMRMYECAREAGYFYEHCVWNDDWWDEPEQYMFHLCLYYLDRFIRVNFPDPIDENIMLSRILSNTDPDYDHHNIAPEERWNRVQDAVLAQADGILSEESIDDSRTAMGNPIITMSPQEESVDNVRSELGVDAGDYWTRRERSESIEELCRQADWDQWGDTEPGLSWAFIGELDKTKVSGYGGYYDCHYAGDQFRIQVPIQILRDVWDDSNDDTPYGSAQFVLIMLEVPVDCVTPILDSTISFYDQDDYWDFDYRTNFTNYDKWDNELTRYRRGLKGDYKYLHVPADVFTDMCDEPPARLRLTVEALSNDILTDLESL